MFTLKFETDNAAFGNGQARVEVASILHTVIAHLRGGCDGGFCTDKDGNCIGGWSLDYHEPVTSEQARCAECAVSEEEVESGLVTFIRPDRSTVELCSTCNHYAEEGSIQP